MLKSVTSLRFITLEINSSSLKGLSALPWPPHFSLQRVSVSLGDQAHRHLQVAVPKEEVITLRKRTIVIYNFCDTTCFQNDVNNLIKFSQLLL